MDGRLVGVAGELPLLRASRPGSLDENDLLHAVEITMQVSEGERVSVSFNRAEEPNRDNLLRGLRRAPQPTLFAELEPGDDTQTYTLENVAVSFPIANIRHVFVRPTDAAGAEFEIESVRLVAPDRAPAFHRVRSGLAGVGGDLP